MLGARAALLAAAVLAVLPIHLYFSRISLNLVEDSLFLVLVLWMLDRALVDGRRSDAVLAGLALGFSQYFYFGTRLLPILTVILSVGRSRGGTVEGWSVDRTPACRRQTPTCRASLSAESDSTAPCASRRSTPSRRRCSSPSPWPGAVGGSSRSPSRFAPDRIAALGSSQPASSSVVRERCATPWPSLAGPDPSRLLRERKRHQADVFTSPGSSSTP